MKRADVLENLRSSGRRVSIPSWDGDGFNIHLCSPSCTMFYVIKEVGEDCFIAEDHKGQKVIFSLSYLRAICDYKDEYEH